MVYSNMAALYEEQKQHDQVGEHYNKALAIILQLGEDHPLVKQIYGSIAGVYEAQGEMEKVREMRKKKKF